MNARSLTATLAPMLAALFALTAIALSGPAAALAEEACPNAQFRTGYAASLSDCRAYELVTPRGSEPDILENYPEPRNVIQGGKMPGAAKGVFVSVAGERIVYETNFAPEGSPGDGIYFMATRGASGWSTQDLIPKQSANHGLVCENAYTVDFSPDLSKDVLADGFGQEQGTGVPCGVDEPALSPNEPRGYQNLFLEDSNANSYQLIDVTPPGVSYFNAGFQAASEDLNHVVFDERAELTPEAPAADDLYEWSDGTVRLVTFLPDGSPVEGSLANASEPEVVFSYAGPEMFTHAVSADGSRVFFYAQGDLYVRENAYEESSTVREGHCTDPTKACTVQVDASQAGGPGGGGHFLWASANGSKVFFRDDASAALTTDTVPGSGQNLYEYDRETAKLTDLTPASEAEALGMTGLGEDGSYAYFVALGAITGAQQNSVGATAESGQPNLYLSHAGAVTYIATLASTNHSCVGPFESEPCGGDYMDWDLKILTSRVSPNGQYLAFNSVRSLTGYDNSPARPGACAGENEYEAEACQEIYRYDANQNKLSCVSCDPSGAPPTAPAGIYEPDADQYGGPTPPSAPGYLQRNVLDDGRVIFSTAQALVPDDTNGQYDVYEYEDGQDHLISTGTSGVGSYFYEADPSGGNIFFVTAEQLPLGNPEADFSLYDARVGGGFPEPAPLTQCSEEDCKGTFSAPPGFSAPSSATFVGRGNAGPGPAVVVKPKARRLQCKKGHVKKHGKCVKRPKLKKTRTRARGSK